MKALITVSILLLLVACAPPVTENNTASLSVPSSSSEQLPSSQDVSSSVASQQSVPTDDSTGSYSTVPTGEITSHDYYDDRLFGIATTDRPPLPTPENSDGFDFAAIDYSLLPQERWEQHSRADIVMYYKLFFEPSPNIDLWHRFQKSFTEGKADSVLLYLNGEGFPSVFYELTADGSPTYTIKSYSSDPTKEYSSSSILYNDFFVCFAPEVKEITGNDWTYSNTVLYTKPMGLSVIPYVAGSNDCLGEVSPDQAIELALATIEGIAAPKPPSPKQRTRIIGALSIYGHPCYVIKTSSPQYDEQWTRTIAVNADGGNLVFLADQMGGAWFLQSDTNMQIAGSGNG